MTGPDRPAFPGLDPGTASVVRLSAALGRGGEEAVEDALEAASRRVGDGGLRREAVEEAILQAHLFLGYPAALTALGRWRRLGHPAPEPRSADAEERRSRGERVCRAVYGENYGKLRNNVAALHPDMDRWMVEEGYGRVLGRPGLELRVRELCIVAQLAGSGYGPQLHSHLRGALNAGASPEEVEAALRIAAGDDPPERALPEAWELWRRARPDGAA